MKSIQRYNKPLIEIYSYSSMSVLCDSGSNIGGGANPWESGRAPQVVSDNDPSIL
ncbi:MAG: hypothetical protein IJS00_04240 [Paludibacteraceae bacterium]|nr:hypothetical protein [Paludibacteraceae bacterium]